MKKPKNILLIITHDTGRRLGCYGYEPITPNMDRIGSDGIRFDHMYTVAPQCSPSRASLFTGKYPQNHGLMELTHRRELMECDPSVALPQLMQDAGYETHLFGFHHERDDPKEMGYQFIHSATQFPEQTRDYAPAVTDLFETFLEEQKESSFFTCLGFHETHLPYERPGYPHSDPEDITLPAWLEDTEKNRHDYAHFEGTLRVADQQIGRITSLLEKHHLTEDTLLIYTTDHGIDFPQAKQTLKDAGLETGLLLRWPAQISGGQVDGEMRSNIDLTATLAECVEVGEEVLSEMDGESFLPSLLGEESPGRDQIFGAMTYHVRYKPMRCVRTHRFKYIRFYDPEALTSLVSDSEWLENFAPTPLEEPEALYDLEQDPNEKKNLIDLPNWQETANELRETLEKWLKETNDPILSGPISKWDP
jgi:arylsulfatase A-like enzyme